MTPDRVIGVPGSAGAISDVIVFESSSLATSSFIPVVCISRVVEVTLLGQLPF